MTFGTLNTTFEITHTGGIYSTLDGLSSPLLSRCNSSCPSEPVDRQLDPPRWLLRDPTVSPLHSMVLSWNWGTTAYSHEYHWSRYTLHTSEALCYLLSYFENSTSLITGVNMPRGILSSLAILILLGICTVFFSCSISPGAFAISQSTSPLLTGYKTVFGDNIFVAVFSWLLIIGLLASFHSFILVQGHLLHAIGL